MEKWLWYMSVLSQGSDCSSQAGNLVFQSHRVHSDVTNQDIGFQENAGYIALFTIALISLDKEYAIFLLSEEL